MSNQNQMKPVSRQSREVFISDRMVRFQHNTKQLDTDAMSRRLIGEVTPGEIELLIHDFLTETGLSSLELITDNVDSAWNAFLQNFDVVEAAGGLVLDERSRLLMIHRYGKWDLPKGKLEQGENIVEGAMREVVEECGIQIERMIRPLEPSHHTYVHKGRKCLKRTHWFLFSGHGNPVPQEEEGIIAAEWLDESQVQLALKETYRSIQRVVGCSFPDGQFR